MPTAPEVAELWERMARAPFLSARSLERHLAKRISEGQWRLQTSPAKYDADLRLGVAGSDELVLGTRRGGTVVLALGTTRALLAAGKLGLSPLPFFAVIYSGARDRLISGYQYSGAEAIELPQGAIWLR